MTGLGAMNRHEGEERACPSCDQPMYFDADHPDGSIWYCEYCGYAEEHE